VERNRTIRVLRQLLGSWRKSEQVDPTTFKTADQPSIRTQIINGPADQTADARLAVRGLSRADTDYYAANALAIVAQQRWLKLSPELAAKPFFVRSEAHALPGMFVMGAATSSKSAASVIVTAKQVLESLIDSPATQIELDLAKNQLVDELNKRQAKPEIMVDLWLDMDTFQLPPVSEQMQSVRTLSASDLQRVARRLFQEKPIASILLGDSKQLQTEVDGRLQTEVMGDMPKPATNPPD
jgi:predicted Zn-dependent peptidase